MGNENGEWIMHGLAYDDPQRIKTAESLIETVERVGFLPLFRNEVPGFSVEEKTFAADWWTDDPKRDPWAWRGIAAVSGRVAYGKLFDRKAGFVSKEWFPAFANTRRDGYDFDARWEDELASWREKKVMDCFSDGAELMSPDLKRLAGFGKGGEANFEGTVTSLQMKTYLLIREFRCRLNKSGMPYGWALSVYTTPESLWGEEFVCRDYNEAPETSFGKILDFVKTQVPSASETDLTKLLK